MSTSSTNLAFLMLSRTVVYSSIALIPFLLREYSVIDRWNDRFSGERTNNGNEVFDFIVVGAGSSGSVVAHRLAENFKVLLLEAGGTPHPLMSVPAATSLFPNDPNYDWGYKTVPQKQSCLSLKNNQSAWTRGKALGGTSILNFMGYIRGHHLDYDNWAHLVEDDRWNYQNMLRYFKKSENYQEPGAYNERYHGKGGEVNIELGNHRPIAPYFIKAAKELGYPQVDINAPYDEGFGYYQYTKKFGRRWNAYNAFLQKPASNQNLKIYKYAFVRRVLLKGSNNFAYGVEYEKNGQILIAQASKEIIISAGSIGSPAILMHSGIGPSEHLRTLGIKPIMHLPGVGQNLQDHIAAYVGPFTINQTITYILDRETQPSILLNYLRFGSGPLTSTGIEATGLLLSNYSKTRYDPDQFQVWPDIQLILAGLSLPENGPKLLSNIFNLREDVSEEYYRIVAGKDSFHIMSQLSRPKSKGRILLKSSNPKDTPLIDPNYLSEPEDMAVLLEGIKVILDLVENTKSFQSLGAKLSTVPFPSCKSLKYRSDEYWECYIRQYAVTNFHPSSSCSMGTVSDPNAVVDTRLKVYGVENLRVIDASIQPQIISTNIQAICIAIGEIGADFIKESWIKKKYVRRGKETMK